MDIACLKHLQVFISRCQSLLYVTKIHVLKQYTSSRNLLFFHWQGIIHRDVKPGNFLFSRKAKKGYLIDFNLALVSYIFPASFMPV